MTPNQLRALQTANPKDFILIQRTPTDFSLLFVASLSLTPPSDLHILVKSIPEPTRQDIWFYQRYGTWLFDILNSQTEPCPLSELLQPEDVLTVRPSVEMLRGLMGGGCLYDRCEDGLVRTAHDTQLAVPWRRSLERVRASGAWLDAWTICPYCMGWELFDRHEHLADAWTVDQYPVEVGRAHLRAINAKREEMGYEWMTPGIQLSTLTFGAQRSRRNHSVRERNPVQGRPILSTHRFEWYKRAQERVLEAGCAICRQDFQDGESIADLPCEHFYHERCLRQQFDYRNGPPSCPMCQRAVALR